MLNELIDCIEIHQAEKFDGEWVQKLTIHYNCVGAIFIPDIFPSPVPDVSVNTRKGVVVNYAHAKSQHKKRVFLQLFKCYKNTRHDCGSRLSENRDFLVRIQAAGYSLSAFLLGSVSSVLCDSKPLDFI